MARVLVCVIQGWITLGIGGLLGFPLHEPLPKQQSMEASPFLLLAKLAKPGLLVVQVNMLEAKSQLSRLVKAALAGEEVIIASHGKAQVRLVPCLSAAGLKRPGALAAASPDLVPAQVDAAFSEAVDQQVAQLFNG
ncbi:MAG: type II toxin-antitoxin system Phd/YefM family antitoxin [Prochlorococcaceae cyanobacterium]